MGNDFDKNCVPHDKKIAEKAFEADNISEIFFKASHFSEPKKYKKEEFWDAISEPTNKEKKYKPKYEDKGRNEDKKEYHPRKKNYEHQGEYRPRRQQERQEEPQKRGPEEQERELR